MVVSQDGKEDFEASEEGGWENGVSADADIDCACGDDLVSYMIVIKDVVDISRCKALKLSWFTTDHLALHQSNGLGHNGR